MPFEFIDCKKGLLNNFFLYLNGKEKFAEPDSKFMLLNRPTNEARASKNEWANPSFVAAYPGLRNENVCFLLQSKVAPLVMVLVAPFNFTNIYNRNHSFFEKY